ncbi:MAG: flagellar biosynthetic protein FliR [Clostridiales bacterium GWF2_38_85]|nr:MAG: flagellar biosynthetic protein FliR [Clostridiales bacterium GWF2_38_85]HBL83424.1 flagellar biosynthetic protein FliR [Clostridiales bacterium]
MDIFNDLQSNYILLLLVVTRISGAFLFNPFFGRKSVPAIVKIGLAILIAIGIVPTFGSSNPVIGSLIEFIFVVIKEMLVGFTIGFIIQLVMSLALIAGESIDMQLGLGMGKVYDPQSNVSMALTGTVYNILFTFLFFLSNSHLTMIRLVTKSCELFPVGTEIFNFEIGSYIVLIFGDILILALKLAIPIIAIEFLTEAGLGVLMRIVPHINVFIVGLQIKLGVGLIIVFLVLPTTSRVLDSSMTYMFARIEEGISIMLKQ